MIARAHNHSHLDLSVAGQPERVTHEALSDADVDRLLNEDADRRPAAGWHRVVKWAVIGLVVAGTYFAGERVYQTWSPAVAATTHSSDERLRAVNVERPTPSETSNVLLPASVRPWQTATLHARVSGYVVAWHRDLGSPVNAGELLAEIEAPELDQELAESESLASEADASAVQAKAELAETEADLKVAEAQLVRAQAEATLAKSQLARRQKLVVNQVVTQEEFETFVREVDARSADVTAAEADVARRRTNLETRAAVIEARLAFAKSRQSNVDRQRELQDFKRIVAPFDGVITRRSAEVGMLVTVGQEPLFVVEDMSRVRVQVNVPQTYSMQTTVGVEASVSLPEATNQAVRATITRVADSVESSSRTMLAEIELENSEHHFQPGSYAQVSLATRQREAAWTIPTSALSMRVEGPHVAVVDDQGQIELRPVGLGRDLGSRVMVLKGIEGGEQLVINPTDDLIGGVRVRVGALPEPGQAIAQR